MRNKESSNKRYGRDGVDNHKEVQMICGTRRPKRLLKWLKRRWVNLEVLDLGVKNRGGGMKVFRAKLE